MSRRTIGLAVGCVAGAVVAIALVLFVGLGDGAPEAQRDPGALPASRSIARGFYTPAVHRFGEPVTATTELLVPKGQLQLETLRAEGRFDPYEVVSSRRVVLDAGERSLVRYTIELRCLKEACVPRGGTREFEPQFGGFTWFTPPPPGRKLKDRRRDARRVSFEWPALKVVSRLGADDVRDVAWRSTLAELPEPRHRISPGRLAGFVLGIAVLLVLVAAALVAWWLRREWRTTERAEAALEEPPPLEQALTLVGENGGGERRRLALQTLARELRRGGAPELADEAERLAWSESEPDERAVDAFTASVRGATA